MSQSAHCENVKKLYYTNQILKFTDLTPICRRDALLGHLIKTRPHLMRFPLFFVLLCEIKNDALIVFKGKLPTIFMEGKELSTMIVLFLSLSIEVQQHLSANQISRHLRRGWTMKISEHRTRILLTEVDNKLLLESVRRLESRARSFGAKITLFGKNIKTQRSVSKVLLQCHGRRVFRWSLAHVAGSTSFPLLTRGVVLLTRT